MTDFQSRLYIFSKTNVQVHIQNVKHSERSLLWKSTVEISNYYNDFLHTLQLVLIRFVATILERMI